MSSTSSKSLPWDIVEKTIIKEQKWLSENLIKPFYKEREDFYKAEFCENCILRQIAILIISGRVFTTDIKSTKCLWGDIKVDVIKPHGSEWHAQMMSLVAHYFKSSGFEVTLEPYFNKGRADLGIFKKGKKNLYVEIGSVSLPKLLFNLESMEDSIILLVLDEKHAIEFYIKKADYKHRTI